MIASFSGEAGLVGLLSDPVRISNVRLEGLEINVPPGGLSLSDDEPDDPSKSDRPGQPGNSVTSPLVVRNLQSERAVVRILRRKPGKAPRVWNISQLDMKDVGADHPWPFRANLTNPTPPGRIQTEGTFGPWQAEEPSQTPLAASYRFENADLGVFDGIAGILNSSGAFKGVLERIEVDGTTSMPAFALADVGNGVPLETRFHSIVDGTNGNTLLQPVEATLGATKIHATGGVVEREGEDGRTVELDVVIDAGQLEDVLRLAVKGPQPPMTGVLKLRTAFLLPSGDRDAIRKLRLDGNFSVDRAEFTKAQVQDKVDAFSTKARGVKDDTPDPVVSNFRGTFRMRDGVIHFSNVTFTMPGARVSVNGRFVMESEALDFRGVVRLDDEAVTVDDRCEVVLSQDRRRDFPSRRHHRRTDYHRGHGRQTQGRPRLREGHQRRVTRNASGSVATERQRRHEQHARVQRRTDGHRAHHGETWPRRDRPRARPERHTKKDERHRHSSHPRRRRDGIVERPRVDEQEGRAHEATEAAGIISAESGAGKRGERDRDDERHAKDRPRPGRGSADARASGGKLQACKGERRDTDDEAAEHVRGEMASQVHT